MSAFWHTAAGIVVGGIISTGISYIFARQSSRELAREAQELRRLTFLLIELVNLSKGIVATERDSETGAPLKWAVMDSEEEEGAEPRPAREEAQTTTQHQQAQRPTEGQEHHTTNLKQWTTDIGDRPQEGAQRPWWRRVFGG